MVNKSLKTHIGIATVAAALTFAVPFITEREGESLNAYRDAVGVWTICHGETYGVAPGDKLTQSDCKALSQSRIGMFMLQITPLIQAEISPMSLAAHTSFAYNIGIDGYKRSSALRYTNQGNVAEGCKAMDKWFTAGGKDCRVRSSGCYGLWQRRQDEIALCLSGVRNGASANAQ